MNTCQVQLGLLNDPFRLGPVQTNLDQAAISYLQDNTATTTTTILELVT